MTKGEDPINAQPLAIDGISTSSGGLTKLEYFAAQAMNGILTNVDPTCDQVLVCNIAVKMADTLIAVLNGEQWTKV